MKLEQKDNKLYVTRIIHIQIEAYGIALIRYFIPINFMQLNIDEENNYVFYIECERNKQEKFIIIREKYNISHSIFPVHKKSEIIGWDSQIIIRNTTDKEINLGENFCLGYYERTQV